MSLSRDTTEMDLKQRREIRSNSAFHIDQVLVLSFLHRCRYNPSFPASLLFVNTRNYVAFSLLFIYQRPRLFFRLSFINFK